MFESGSDVYNITNDVEESGATGNSVEYLANMCNNTGLSFTLLGGGTSGNESSANCSNDDQGVRLKFDNPFNYTHIRAIFIVLYSIVFVCCFVGNLFVIIVVLKHRRMRTITNFFLANLAIADLCVGIFCVLPNLSQYLSPYWLLGKVMCKVYYFVQASSYTASITILTVMSIERYFAIIYPIQSKQMTTMCMLRVTIVVVWCISAASGVPFLFIMYTKYHTYPTGDTIAFCIMNHDMINMKVYVVVNFMLWYLLPLALMTVMYTKISVVLWQSSRGDQSRKAGGSGAVSHLSSGPKKKIPPTTPKQLEQKSKRGETLDSDDKAQTTRGPSRSGQNGRGRADDQGSANEHQKLMESSDFSSPYESAVPAHTRIGEDSPEESSEYGTNIDYEDDWPDKKNSRQNIPMFKLRNKSGKGSPKSPYKTTGRNTDSTVNGRMASEKNKKPVKGSSTTGPRRKEKKAENNPLLARRRVIRLLITVICSFAVCVLPYHIRILWQTFTVPRITFSDMLIPPITFVVFYLNSGLNPILYAFLSDRFRQCLTEVFTCRDNIKSRQSQISFTSKTLNSTVHY